MRARLILALALIGLLGFGLGQEHRVSTQVPVVLRLAVLELNLTLTPDPETMAIPALELPLGHYTLKVVANTRWTLWLKVQGEVLLNGEPLAPGLTLLQDRGVQTLRLSVLSGGPVRVQVDH